jgi:hypothetical protein
MDAELQHYEEQLQTLKGAQSKLPLFESDCFHIRSSRFRFPWGFVIRTRPVPYQWRQSIHAQRSAP